MFTSFKSVKIIEEWNELLLECINELMSDNNDEINGISILKKNLIIKIWFKNSDFKYQNYFKRRYFN